MIPTAVTAIRLRRRLAAIAIAVIAAAALLYVSAEPVEAADVCTGPGCDTIAFADSQARFDLYEDLVASSDVGSFLFGNPGDEPLMGDWDCDGDDTPAMYRRSQGFMYLRNSNTQGVADLKFYFGNPGDIPLAGDFNGDGCDTLSIYRPSRARVYISNELGNGPADYEYYFGNIGDVPFVGDFNDDGTDTIALHRRSTGLVYYRNSNSAGFADRSFVFGDPNDRVFAGDWNGDGIDTVGAYRPSNGTVYLMNRNSGGVADHELKVGSYQYVLPASGIGTVPSGGGGGGGGGGGAAPPPGLEPPPARTPSGEVYISGQSGVVIENLHITNPGGHCITVQGASNVTIRNSTIGPCGDHGVYLDQSTNVTVTGNYITENTLGVLAHYSNSIKVDGNAFLRTGRNFVQFVSVEGAGSSVSSNRGANDLGGSNAEDLISMFESNGTPESPIVIAGNYLRDGGPSGSGSGIMLGDGGGSHQIARGNRLVNPGQVGIGVAAGSNMKVQDNQVYSEALPWSNVGIYTMNLYDGCDTVEVTGNQVNWTAAAGHANGYFSDGACGNLSVSSNNWEAGIGPGIW
jgi:parallel beta-helix repeat protein